MANPPPDGSTNTEWRSMTMVEGDDIAFSRVENAQDFLPARVGQISQDDRGFMWFGTQYGLYRFDGYGHIAFSADPTDRHQPGGIFVYAIRKDRAGRLWISTDGGLDVFDPRTGTFRRLHYAVTSAVPLVQAFYEDPQGLMWLATTGGLYALDAEGNVRSHFHADPTNPTALASTALSFATRDRAGTLWIAGSAGLEAIDPASGRVRARIALPEPREISFTEDRNGMLWIAHAGGNGLSSFDRSSNTLTHYRFVDGKGAPVPRFGIFSTLKDRDGGLWLGTGGAGLLRLDVEQRRVVRYRNNPGDPQSLSGDDVAALFQDRDGDVWVALHGERLNLFSPRKAPFYKLPPRPASVPSRSEKMVNAILEVDERTLLISYLGMLLGVDRATGQREDLHRTLGLQADVISMAKDARGRLWLGTVGTGVVMREPSGRLARYRHDPRDPRSLPNDVVNDILVDRSQTLWFATWGGLARFDERNGTFDTYRPKGLDPKYLALTEGDDGTLWLGTHRYGLHRFDPATKVFTSYPPTGAPRGVSNGRINAVHVDRRGAVWVGTQNGLDRLDPATGRIRGYRAQDGLPGNAVSCLMEDARGGLWLGTNNGIARRDAATGKMQGYSRSDGLPGLDFTGWGTCHHGASDTMYFGGFSGGTAFQPDQVRAQGQVPSVALTDLTVAGRRFPADTTASQPQVLPVPDALTLPYSQNSFTAGFAALRYANPSAIDYRFRLAGLEEDWHVVGSDRRVAAYNSLPPGNYRLEVQASVGGGAWSDSKALALTILRPWWQAQWFHLLVGLLLVGAVLLAYRLRVRQVTQRFEIRLDERVAERTRIARELHDSLLQGFHGLMFRLQAVRNLLPARPNEAATVLDEALRRGDDTVKMAREAVTDLRTFGANSLDLEAALRMMMEDMGAPYSDDPPECRITVEGTPHPMIPLVRDDVLQIAREAVRNALQHAHASLVLVEVLWGAHRFVLRVQDDGIGLDPGFAEHGRDGHWGLHGMRERTRDMGGSLEIRSEGTGTQVELGIPASRAYVRAS
jgi:ligand-binding sensor domain-containing protein/signal transduction histidine kinase